jgi:hypothetical protein
MADVRKLVEALKVPIANQTNPYTRNGIPNVDLVENAKFINSFMPISGDIQSGIQAVDDVKNKKYASALLNSVGLLPFVPSLGGMVKDISIYKNLENLNKSTAPKIPVNNIFKNDYKIIPSESRKLIDNIIDLGKEKDLPIESVDISKIVPTQKNVNISNMKDVSNIKNPKDEILAVKNNENYYIVDGHHRIANEILNNKENVNMRVLDSN